MPEKILLVDDDPNLLAACKRNLRNLYDVHTAVGGQLGLEEIDQNGPFALVVADMRMPGMDGIQFLKAVREKAPDTVRIMLTGNADMDTAVNAVNEGSIFRFLSKPCPKENLIQAVDAGVHQYGLVVAERQLLEETLNGSIKVLVDILTLVNPKAFGRASRVRRYVRYMAESLKLPDVWQFEVAAMLSQIGCISLSPELMSKVYAGQPLSEKEQEVYGAHPEVGGRLIFKIPRLDHVAHMIARQREPYSWNRSEEYNPVAVGGNLLKVALDFDALLARDATRDEALEKLRSLSKIYDPSIVKTLEQIEIEPPQSRLRAVMVNELEVGMIFDEDVLASNGNLLISKGQEATTPVIEHLRRWVRGAGVKEPVRVQIKD